MILELLAVWILGGIFFAVSFDVENKHPTTVGSIAFGGLLGIGIMAIAFLITQSIKHDIWDKNVLEYKEEVK